MQAARRWNIAFLQAVVYNGYLPAIGVFLDPYIAYSAAVDPGVDVFLATAAMRFGHSEVAGVIYRVDEAGKEIPERHLTLQSTYFAPSRALSAGIEPILRGFVVQRQKEADLTFDAALQNSLFGDPCPYNDLVALNIQRGRDHGLPDWNTARGQLGLPTFTSFNDSALKAVMSQANIDLLYVIYGANGIGNVDAYVGGLAETHVAGSAVGPTFLASLRDQFTRLRDGDRFYFDNLLSPNAFTVAEADVIRRTQLNDIVARNTPITSMPRNVFKARAIFSASPPPLSPPPFLGHCWGR